MQLEVGAIIEGKVTGITNFGAFVDIGDGKTGMVHISEVAPTFVKEIREFVSEGQTVKVKVLDIAENGKVALSIKKAMPQQPKENRAPRQNNFGGNNAANAGGSAPRTNSSYRRPSQPPVQPYQSAGRPGNFEWSKKKVEGGSFEDMMSRFKQSSDEKMSDLKRVTETRRGSSRRGNKA